MDLYGPEASDDGESAKTDKLQPGEGVELSDILSLVCDSARDISEFVHDDGDPEMLPGSSESMWQKCLATVLRSDLSGRLGGCEFMVDVEVPIPQKYTHEEQVITVGYRRADILVNIPRGPMAIIIELKRAEKVRKEHVQQVQEYTKLHKRLFPAVHVGGVAIAYSPSTAHKIDIVEFLPM